MAYKVFAVDLREMPAHFNRVYKEVEFSSAATQLIKNIGLNLQPDPRLIERSSFEIYFTPPSTPGADKRTVAAAAPYNDDYDWPELVSSKRKKINKDLDTRGRSLKTNVYSDIRVFTKFQRRPNTDT